MAKKTYTWPDGTKNHSITWNEHVQNSAGIGAAATQGLGSTYHAPGYSVDQINTLNGIIPGGTGVQGVPGVTSTPGGVIPPGWTPPATATPTTGGTGAAAASSNPLIEGVFNDANTGADTQYRHTLAGINFDDGALVQDIFGWDPGKAVHGADGSLDIAGTEALGVNPDDPFSKMSLLTRSYQQQQNRSQNSYAAGGHLFSGAYGRAKASDLFNNDQSRDDLFKAFEASGRGNNQNRLTASDTKAGAIGTAASNRLNSYLGS